MFTFTNSNIGCCVKKRTDAWTNDKSHITKEFISFPEPVLFFSPFALHPFPHIELT